MLKWNGKKLLLIGWDAADWQIINPLIADGTMPNLAKLIQRGVWGNLASMSPMLSPMLWTSIGTGKRPHKHGIFGFVEPKPDRSGVRPASSLSRKTHNLWNMMHRAGLRSNAVAWYASHPAEPVNGAVVSNLYPVATPDGDTHLSPLPPGTVHPGRLAEPLGNFRIHPAELTISDLGPFLTPEQDVTLEDDTKLLGKLQKQLAEVTRTHTAATALMEKEPWDFMTVYYASIDHFCHEFMEFRAPQREGISDRDFRNFRDVVDNAYRFHDLMLGRKLQMIDDDTIVLICSDHGFLNDHMRPEGSANMKDNPVAWHRFYGMFVLAGPGIRAGEQVYGATLLDLLPTMLTALGLPVGEDMDGKVLLQAFDDEPEVQWVPSWDTLGGDFGTHDASAYEMEFESEEALQQLIDLGYIAEADDDQKKRIEVTIREQQQNMIAALRDAKCYVEAEQLLAKLFAENPEEEKYRYQHVECLILLGRLEEARELLKDARDEPEFRMAHLLMSSHVERLDPEGDKVLADQLIEQATANDNSSPGALMLLASMHLRRKNFEQAEQLYSRILDQDPTNAHAMSGKAEALLKLHKFEEAAEAALDSVQLLYLQPEAHMTLALALARLGDFLNAARAMEVRASMPPANPRCHRLLAHFYMNMAMDDKAARHRQIYHEMSLAYAKRATND